MSKSDPQYAIDDRFLDQPYTLAGRLIDPVSGMLSWQGKREHLRRKELEVLALLASADGKQVSRENFIAVVWQGNDLVGDRGLSNTIVFVRKSLHDEDAEHPVIRTIPRRGYQLAVPVQLPVEQAAAQVDVAFAPGDMIPECPAWRLVKRLSQSAVNDSWLAEPSEFGERDQGLRVFRFCRSEANLQRLRREVTLLRYLRDSLGQNQHFALIHDWQLDEPPYFLARDYTAFGNIAQWGGLAAQPLAQRMAMMQGLCDAVAAMHALGVVHRQLSAETILVDKSETGPQLKISAFDLAALNDRSKLAPLKITALGLTQGVEDVSVELTAADDVYGLGSVLLQLALADLQAQPSAEWLSKIPNSKLQTLLELCFGSADARPSADELAAQLQRITAPETAAPALSSPEMEAPVATPTPKAKPPSTPVPVNMPETIGHYRLLDRLGEGGMGSVYLAEQREPYRQVALKIIRSGLDGQQILSRFEAERQALALMNHPNVTTVLDSGLASDGRPFFAMEYVKGDEITHYCDAHNLNLPARIKLFLQVCDGVLHAHQKGVLHRDIKPSNLMVSQAAESAGTVKIIDFGLAKSLHGKLAAHTLHTSFGAFIGTPVYCSPEHISGSAGGVDTRSDIYSMGVVLYELLAGTTPIATESLENLESEKVRELVCSSKLPSMREQLQKTTAEKRAAIAEHRSIKLDELPKTLEGDLSWVVGKCLERDPNDRYASVLELRKDLERWLELRPVEARPTTRWYRLRKMVRRNRGVSILIAASVATILLSTTVAITGYMRAEQALAKEKIASAEAKASLEFQVKQIGALDVRAMGFSLRTTLTQQLSEFVKTLNMDDSEARRTQSRIANALKSINFTDVVIKQLEEHYFDPGIKLINEHYQKSPALQAALWGSTADTLVQLGLDSSALVLREKVFVQRNQYLGPDSLLTLDAKMRWAHALLDQGEASKAESMLNDSVQRTLQLNGKHTEQSIQAMVDLGGVAYISGNLKQVELHYRKALSFSESILGERHPKTFSIQGNLGHHLMMGGALAEAEPLLEKSYANLLDHYGLSNNATLDALQLLSSLRDEQGKIAEAIDLGWKAIEGRNELNGSSSQETLLAMNNQANRLNNAGRHTEALKLLRELEVRQARLGIDKDLTIGVVKGNIGATLLRLGKLSEAEPVLKFALNYLSQLTAPGHPTTQIAAGHLGKLALAQGRFVEAANWYQRVIDDCARASDTSTPRLSSARAGLGLTQLANGDINTARQTLKRAVTESRQVQVKQAEQILRVQAIYARALAAPEAIDLLQEVVNKQKTTPGVDFVDQIESLSQLAKLLNGQAQPQIALSHSTQAIKIGAQIFPTKNYLLATAWTEQGRALKMLGRALEAKAAFEQAQQTIKVTEGLNPQYQLELTAAIEGN